MKIILIPTPIGNLEDISLRALRLLKEVDLIAAEDTRTSGKLLKHYQVETPVTSLHQHNEHKKVPLLLDRVEGEELTIGVISDAGTPGISDPGYLLVREAIERGIPVETLPGATAFVPALVNSGLPCDRFVFEGFLPQKKGRQKRMQAMVGEERTIVLYESPYRLVKALDQLAEHLGANRQAAICREITKLHEETARGTLVELKEHFSAKTVKGEIVILIAGEKA